jgi:hypothetical protein
MRFAFTKLLLVSLIFTASAGAVQRPPRNAAAFCTVEGGKGSVKCGGANYMACTELHPNNDEGTGVCQTEEVLPSCCAASPDSPDRTAKECHCCNGARKQSNITIPYDPVL